MRASTSVLLLLLAACAPASAFAAGWETRSTGTSAHVYVPSSTGTRGSGRGLLVALHGCAQTSAQLRQYGNFEASADAQGVVVALPAVPNGGVVQGCWDYYGASHTRANKHHGPVLELVAALVADPALAIDARQVFVAGVSSGAGEAAVLGCLAPDVFSAVGLAAGPAIGTTANGFSFVSTTRDDAVALCRKLAADHASALQTQTVALVQGTADTFVAQGYLALNTEVYAQLLSGGAGLTTTTLNVSALEGASPAGTGTLASDAKGPRLASISSSGLGHAWPAGSGGTGEPAFVARAGLNFGAFAMKFFTENNRRIGSEEPVEPAPDGGTKPVEPVDAGEPEPGTDDGDDDGGCASAGASGAVTLALLAVLFRRRGRA